MRTAAGEIGKEEEKGRSGNKSEPGATQNADKAEERKSSSAARQKFI